MIGGISEAIKHDSVILGSNIIYVFKYFLPTSHLWLKLAYYGKIKIIQNAIRVH